MFELELARAYIDDFLVVSKDSLENHLKHLEEVSPGCHAQDLNSMKTHICHDELEYLRNLINRKEVRPTIRS
jgi:hypothetical protein